jgi:hypothetical protein
MAERLEDMLVWADHVVIAQRPPSEFAASVRDCGKPLLDLACLATPGQTPRRSTKAR